MRLSDAIGLGRMLRTLSLACDEKRGCALHLGLVAIDSRHSFASAFLEWPWLLNPVSRVCKCERELASDIAQLAIIHLFDRHVLGAQDWTLDRLIDYVRSIEPIESHESETNVSVETGEMVRQ